MKRWPRSSKNSERPQVVYIGSAKHVLGGAISCIYRPKYGCGSEELVRSVAMYVCSRR